MSTLSEAPLMTPELAAVLAAPDQKQRRKLYQALPADLQQRLHGSLETWDRLYGRLDEDLSEVLAEYWGMRAEALMSYLDRILGDQRIARAVLCGLKEGRSLDRLFPNNAYMIPEACPYSAHLFPRAAQLAAEALLKALAPLVKLDMSDKDKCTILLLENNEGASSDDSGSDDELPDRSWIDDRWISRYYTLCSKHNVDIGCADTLPATIATVQVVRWLYSSISPEGHQDLLYGINRSTTKVPDWLAERHRNRIPYEVSRFICAVDKIYDDAGVGENSSYMNFFHDELLLHMFETRDYRVAGKKLQATYT